jgi:hypothetical protein
MDTLKDAPRSPVTVEVSKTIEVVGDYEGKTDDWEDKV